MFMGNTTLLVIFVVGAILVFIGIGLKDRNPGLILLGAGFLAIIYAVIRKAIEIFG